MGQSGKKWDFQAKKQVLYGQEIKVPHLLRVSLIIVRLKNTEKYRP